MKITDVQKTPLTRKTGETRSALSKDSGAASTSTPPKPAAVGGFPGIDEADLTPGVRRALDSLMREVKALRRELDHSHERIRELELLADTDPLVGVLNRRAFVRELNRTLAMVDRYDTPSSLIFADLNDLKIINDKQGHAAGDAALAHVANMLASSVRQTDAVGRLGGDEFGVILVQTDQKTGEEKARTLSETVSQSEVRWTGAPFNAHISCGVIEIQKGFSADAALEKADSAMYLVKQQR